MAVVTGEIEDTGGQVFNVRAYGAAGTGTSDDSTAVMDAYNALIDAGGGVLYFPPGTYLMGSDVAPTQLDMTNLVTSPVGIMIVGAGSFSTTIKWAAGLTRPATPRLGDAPALVIGDNSTHRDVVIQDIGFAGPGSTDIGICNAGIDGVQLNGKIQLCRVSISGFDEGLIMNSVNGHVTLDSVALAANFDNLYYLVSGDDHYYFDCDFGTAGRSNVYIDDATEDDIRSLKIERTHCGFSPYGFYFAPGATNYLLDQSELYLCKFEKIGNAAIYVDFGFSSTASISGLTVTDSSGPFTSGMVGKRLVVGGGLNWGIISSVTPPNEVTMTSWENSNNTPSGSGNPYSVNSGTAPAHSYSGSLRDSRISHPTYQKDPDYALPDWPADHDVAVNQIQGTVELWNGATSASFGNIFVNEAPTNVGVGVAGQLYLWGVAPTMGGAGAACLQEMTPAITTLGDGLDLTGNRIWTGADAPSSRTDFVALAGDFYFRTDSPSTSGDRIYICTANGSSGVSSGTWLSLSV